MKFKVVAALSVILIILGVTSLGTMLQDLNQGLREDTYLGGTMAAWFLVGGGLLYWAARKRYSIGWRMYLGAFLVFFGFVGASVEADSIVNLRAEEPVFGFVLAGAFVVAGLLVARSGYWRNIRRSSSRPAQPAQTPGEWSNAAQPAGERVAASDEVVISGSPIDR